MNDSEIKIGVELTPNPNSLKFIVNRPLLDYGSIYFPDKKSAEGSLLSSRIFEVESVADVLVGTNFITVTKKDGPKWESLVPFLFERMKSVLESAETILAPELIPKSENQGGDPVEQKIREVLDREIRPAVARDGGDIVFQSYAEGVVTLHLQGACSTCPSSLMTLRLGVESRLKLLIPEIREVLHN
ncbi:MAG: NifU family protein [Candidatus Omnitrophica bacterium]|nr:NifU family protein [Candidatus Omnitrophota bacterium]